jgi:cytochrome c oxidase subunit 2
LSKAPRFRPGALATRWFLLLSGLVWGGVGNVSCTRPASEASPTGYEVEVVGKDRQWTARYPGPDGTLHSPDDLVTPGQIHVPQGVPVTLHLKSEDRLYLFSLPHEDLSEIAVPGLAFTLNFTPERSGEFPLMGGQLCGIPNQRHGTLHVLPRH